MRPAIIRDIETKSTVDVGDVGAHLYAMHPSTEILCVGYCLDDGPVKIWHPGDPVPAEYKHAIKHRDYVAAAHNAAFERQIEQHILGPKFGFPVFPVERNICTMSLALAAALPGSLDRLTRVLNLEHVKDQVGNRLMLQVSKPRRARKSEDPDQVYYFDDAIRLDRLDQYCIGDVEAARELLDTLPELSEQEYLVWILDQKINDFGIYLDAQLMLAAQKIIDAALPSFNREITTLTDGAVTAVSQVAKLKDWINLYYPVDTLRKDDLDELLKRDDLPVPVRKALELRSQGKHAAIKKIAALTQRRNGDGRIRGAFIYHAAGPGRWCVDADTLIDTPTWPRRIIDLHPGDQVIGGSGQSRKVLAKLYKGREAMYQLAGPDAFVIATAGHRIMTEQGWKRLDDCFQKMASGCFVLRQGCTPVSYTSPYDRRDCNQVRLQLADLEQSLGVDNPTARIQRAETRSVFTQQVGAQKPDVRRKDSSGTDYAAWLSRRLERQRLHPGASSYSDESVEAVDVAERLGGSSHRRRQDKQHAEQFNVSDKARASELAQVEAWSLIPVGERDVWDISVEGDESYFAQGLIHHNSSRGAQVHNLKRSMTEDLDKAIAIISTGSFVKAKQAYPNPLSVIGDLIRATLCAAPGNVLIGADFSGIEARVTAWIAGEKRKLDVFRAFDAGKGPDPYIITAAAVLGVNANDLNTRYEAGDPTAREQRQIGKACELAFGYQGGVNAFRRFMPSGGTALTISQAQWQDGSARGRGSRSGDQEQGQLATDYSESEIQTIKRRWRHEHQRISQFWFALDRAVWLAVKHPGTVYTVNNQLEFECDDQPFLWLALPSGRKLAYPHARIARVFMPRGSKIVIEHANGEPGVLFKDNSAGQWRDVRVYGGLMCENVVQAISRDLLAEAMLRVDQAGFDIVAHVHDECVIEVKEKNAEIAKARFSKLMNEVPSWAEDLPIVAKAWIAKRYVK